MFDRLVDGISAVLWNLRPADAVLVGKHEYDGVVPDVSEEAADTAFRRLRALAGRLDALDGLDAEQDFDRAQLRAVVEGAVFAHEVLRTRERNPLTYVDALDLTPYLTRRYAPAPIRATRASEVLEEAPRLLEQARVRLDPVIPEVFCRWGIRLADGMAASLEEDLSDAFGDLDDRVAEARVGGAAAAAAAELRSFAGWLREERLPAGDGGFPMGEAALGRMIAATELLDTSPRRLLASAEADLAANQAAFREAAAAIDPEPAPGEVYREHVASARVPPGALVETVAGMLEDIRSFVVEHDLVTIPSEVRARVAPTPRHLRWAFAVMSAPGPYEDATEAHYYVTPPEAEWPSAQADEWMAALNTFALEDVSIHEAYPGHYVHSLHSRAAPTEVAKRTASYAFTEGWAHYAEELLWDAGYRDGDSRFRLAQLAGALVRDCRLVCALRMHAGDMELPEAVDFFREHAHYGETPARAEAERGTFDPGYCSYTVGKLEIARLRDRCRAAAGDGFSLRDFHDRLLSRGAPPIGLIDRLVSR